MVGIHVGKHHCVFICNLAGHKVFVKTHQPMVALVIWITNRIAASIQFWMPSSMMIASLQTQVRA